MLPLLVPLLAAAAMAPPPFSWQGKRVLLTGASSGLGESLAYELASRGAILCLAARREPRLASVAAKCAAAAASPTPPTILPIDLAKDASVVEAAARTAVGLLGGRCDVLVNAAGVGQRTDAVGTSAEAHALIMRTNFEGAVALSRALLPPMLERGDGAIVCVSSVQGFFGQPYRSSYAAAKAAAVGYFDSLRAEVADRGVGVTLVAPGYIATDHAASAVGGDGLPDENAKRGMAPDDLAREIAIAVEKGRPELVAAPLDARAAILLRALWPSALFRYMAAKAARGA